MSPYTQLGEVVQEAEHLLLSVLQTTRGRALRWWFMRALAASLRSSGAILRQASSPALRTARMATAASAEGSDTTAGPRQRTIIEKLQEHLQPVHLEVVNESYKHSVPKGSETHFKVHVVSDKFAGMSLIQRHRMVNSLLDEEFKAGLHALSIRGQTPDQFAADATSQQTPNCLGGSKHDPMFQHK